jgi:redox-sensitive bicupin YhaK (pirin superfamily)
MEDDVVLRVSPLGFPWEAADPFLFCVHHDDAYPAGNEAQGPAVPLAGRDLGQDFAGKDGWRMYHGRIVPGFPQHPHRGFETVTVVRRGFIDHSDSMGATARYGAGDVQWLTAGKGIVHAEMFPLRDRANPNPLELFQIWLNLPSADKLAPPHFTMFWKDAVPTHVSEGVHVTLIAGRLGDRRPPSPPPRSWASRDENEVAIWTIHLAPRATWTLPAASRGVSRTLYFFRGGAMTVAGTKLDAHARVRLRADADAKLEAGDEACELLLLQGKPISEPVMQYGPFVMNTRAELQQAFSDYQRTQFGGWPWDEDGPVHAREEGRFAKHADGKVERA